MKKQRRRQHHYYFLMELVMAIGLLAILSAAFFGSLATFRQMDRGFLNERRGLMIIDNTLERVKNIKHYSTADVKRIFNDEFQHCNIKGPEALKISTKVIGKEILLKVIKPNRKILIEVNLKCY